MKNVRKMLSLALALVMCIIVSIPAFATDATNENIRIEHPWVIDKNGDKAYIVGSKTDRSNLNNATVPIYGIVEESMFTMYVDNMVNDIHTTGSKSFTQRTLTRGYLKIQGILNSDNSYVQVGACYYDDGFYAPAYLLHEVDTGEYFSKYYDKSDFDKHYYYYGYAQSPYGQGSYEGRVNYFNAER